MILNIEKLNNRLTISFPELIMSAPPTPSTHPFPLTKYVWFRNLVTADGVPSTGWPGDLAASHPADPSTPKSAWTNPEHEGCFISLIEGASPSLRVGPGNPATVIHGLSADYDDPRLASMSDAEVLAALQRTWGKHGASAPTAWSRSLNRKVHLSWFFSEPIVLPLEPPYDALSSDILNEFLKLMKKKVRAESFNWMFDDSAWTNTSIRFQIGSEWKLFSGTPLSPVLVADEYSEAARIVGTKSLSTIVSLERIHAMCREKFPATCPETVFSEGMRVPCFWITDGTKSQDADAVIKGPGILVYSDKARKAGQPVIFWTDPMLLGRGVIEEESLAFREMLHQDFVCVGESWCILMPDPSTGIRRMDINQSKKSLEERLLELGMQGCMGKPDSALYQFYRELKRTRTVAGLANTFWGPPRIYISPSDGRHYYSETREPLLEPSPASGAAVEPETAWPIFNRWLDAYLTTQGVDADGCTAKEHLLRWLQYAYVSARENPDAPRPGHCLFLVGPPSCGKTWFVNKILGTIFGSPAIASGFLTGQNKFTGTLYDKYLWSVGDAPGKVGCEAIKELVGEGRLQVNVKYGAQFDRRWTGRVVVTLNDSAGIRESLPSNESGMLDKFLVIRLPGAHDGSVWLADLGGYAIPDAVFKAECRALCRWLMETDLHPSLSAGGSRYGCIKPWIDPGLYQEISETSREAMLAAAVASVAREVHGNITTANIKSHGDKLLMSAAGVQQAFAQNPAFLEWSRAGGRLARMLSDLAQDPTYEWITKPSRQRASDPRYYAIEMNKLPAEIPDYA